jgi:heptosyltransferase-2
MPTPRIYPGESERSAVDELLGPPSDAARPLVALAPGSVWGTKRWPYYPELAARIAPRCRLAIVGSADDSGAARRIAHAVGAQGVVDATGKLSLLASAELIGRADLLVTNDSSPQHLASAMATPTITIFGPTVPAFGFGPLAPHSTTLGHPSLPCRPCHHHGPPTCPLGHWKCMRELGVEVVEGAVGSILEGALKRKQEAGSSELHT